MSWGYPNIPNSWMVYTGESHENGMIWGYTHFRTLGHLQMSNDILNYKRWIWQTVGEILAHMMISKVVTHIILKNHKETPCRWPITISQSYWYTLLYIVMSSAQCIVMSFVQPMDPSKHSSKLVKKDMFYSAKYQCLIVSLGTHGWSRSIHSIKPPFE